MARGSFNWNTAIRDQASVAAALDGGGGHRSRPLVLGCRSFSARPAHRPAQELGLLVVRHRGALGAARRHRLDADVRLRRPVRTLRPLDALGPLGALETILAIAPLTAIAIPVATVMPV